MKLHYIGIALVALSLASCSVFDPGLDEMPSAAAQGQAGPGVDPELVARGEKQFLRCSGCHSMKADSRGKTGPHLKGLIGREVAAVEGFDYSEALRAQTFTWDERRFDEWLASPDEDVPHMCAPFRGLQDPADRAALIAYIKSAS